MIRINQIKMEVYEGEERLYDRVCSLLHIDRRDIIKLQIVKKSIDARKKPHISLVYSVEAVIKNENRLGKRVFGKDICKVTRKTYSMPRPGSIPLSNRPVVAGMGPAGLFCGYFLAKAGYMPIILERGEAVEERKKTVERFWQGGPLNTESNVQFGEGGAGTFSDGKLNTAVKDKDGKHLKVLETFVQFGANEEIKYVNKPHIGTDVLCGIVKNMREAILQLGGEVRFNSKLTDIEVNGGKLSFITVNGSEKIACENLVLALGHSARDTFEMLFRHKLYMEPKAFAVGVRVEHPQSLINLNMYGTEDTGPFGAADYKVTYTSKDNRGVYSFCMCPGGYVINASSEPGCLAVNGMSYSKRDGRNANSAVIVTVRPEDYGDGSPLSGMEFQRELERRAYSAGRGAVPVQLFGDFEAGRPTERLGKTEPSIKGAYALAKLNDIFPEYINNALIEGIHAFAGQIKGYDSPDMVLSGVESRTSSPLRLCRNESMASNIEGIYPCGEGAGYAGGITSAAMDGIRVFEAIASKYSPLRRIENDVY